MKLCQGITFLQFRPFCGFFAVKTFTDMVYKLNFLCTKFHLPVVTVRRRHLIDLTWEKVEQVISDMDGRQVINFKYIPGLCLVMILGLQGSVNCTSDIFKPAEEVVSIYGPNFDIRTSQEPYFIKINRCITVNDVSKFNDLTQDDCWSVPVSPKSRQKIEIVVPDLNNEKKFYEYVVYNDTACRCGILEEFEKQYKRIDNREINEAEFKRKLDNNPVNVRSCRKAYCSKPQPRYFINDDDRAHPADRYILFHKCLPGCNSTAEILKKVFGDIMRYSKYYTVPVKQDTACSPYLQQVPIPGQRQAFTNRKSPNYHNSKQESHAPVSQNGMVIEIHSTQLLLSAFVLSVILLLILLVDCNLFYRKKGMLYNIMCCKKHRQETDCENCSARQRNITEV